jgi:2-iminobutanoate/2-iminopropanoate deaminase
MERRHIDIPDKKLPRGMDRWPFSDAVRAGDTLYLSGRLGLDPETRRPPADVSEEARMVMDDVQRVLRAAALTCDDLVMVTIFGDATHFAAFNAVYLSYFNGPPPARAFIGSGPLLFGARFEITAIAIASS